MQAADNVKLGRTFPYTLFGTLIDFFESVSVCARGIRVAPKRAKFAMRDADIRGIDVAVDVEIGDVAVLFFADVVGEPADREQVRRTIQFDAILKRQPFARENLVRDGFQSAVCKNQFAQVVRLFRFSPVR